MRLARADLFLLAACTHVPIAMRLALTQWLKQRLGSAQQPVLACCLLIGSQHKILFAK